MTVTRSALRGAGRRTPFTFPAGKSKIIAVAAGRPTGPLKRRNTHNSDQLRHRPGASTATRPNFSYRSK